MYEPKYKLNKKDEKRWRELLLRHCLEEIPEGQRKRMTVRQSRRAALGEELTPEESQEFEALTIKRNRKIEAKPEIRESIRCTMQALEETEQLLKELSQRLAEARDVKLNVDKN